MRARVIDKISSVEDHIFFLAIFIIGAFFIALLRLAFDLSAYLTIIVPLILMFLYMYFVWKTKRYRLREDRAADNLYYLGFLFTVTSLLIALSRYTTSSNQDVNQIIGDLGIGLITTVVGLVGRIFFTQLRQDPEEIEEQTRLMLADVAEKTKAQLFATNETLTHVQIQSRQIMHEAKDSIDTANQAIVESLMKLNEKIEAIEIPDNIITSKINPLLDNFNKSLTEITDKSLNEITSVQSNLQNQQQQYSETLEIINQHRNGMIQFNESLQKLFQNQENLVNWANSIAKNETSLTGLNDSLKNIQKTISNFSILVDGFLNTAQGQQENYQNAVNSMTSELSKTETGIKELADTIQLLAEKFSKAMRELAESAEQASRK